MRRFIASLLLLTSLLFMALSGITASAEEEYLKWTGVNIPAEGKAGDWVLAAGSDVKKLHMAADGTLYAYVSGLTYTLYRSPDGYHWSYIGNVRDEIVEIATSPGPDHAIYYATASLVYRSTDAGKTFQSLPAQPGGSGDNNVQITSIAVTRAKTNIIAVSTLDTDSGEFGGVYTLDEGEIIPDWEDTGIGAYDVYALAFSPNYTADRLLAAVVSDETDSYLATRAGAGNWGETFGTVLLNRDNSGGPVSIGTGGTAVIAFPGDYGGEEAPEDYTLYAGVNTGSDSGDVYEITLAEGSASSARDLDAGGDSGSGNIDITGLAASGQGQEATLLAGATDSAYTYLSSDGGETWTRTRKRPTGNGSTDVLMASDFITSRRAYAATSGSGSAFSVTEDGGLSWNQTGLVDTQVSALLDLAPSPGYEQDGTLFLLSFGGGYSLWRTTDNAATWERIFTSALENVDSLSLVALPPQYGPGRQSVFLAGESNGRGSIWKTDDNGQTFHRRFAIDPDSGSSLRIDAWAVADEDTLFVGAYDGSNGMVYRTGNGGFFYSRGAPAGNQALNRIVLSPGYQQDRNLLAGNGDGWAYWSDDDGDSFAPLPGDASSAPLSGTITVAFDPGFATNRTVYAASTTTDAGIHRFVIGRSSNWESIDGSLPAGGTVNSLINNTEGTLYGSNSDDSGGIERSLNPRYSLGPSFESVSRGLNDGATLSGLWNTGHRLWSFDSTANRLYTYYDSLTGPVKPVTPSNLNQGLGTVINHTLSNISLDWETLPGATSYQWQLDYDTDFSSVPDGFEGTTRATTVRLPSLEPGTTYYWRVRAAAPVLSPWSEKMSFTSNLDTSPASLDLESPRPGAADVLLNPVFQWNKVGGADSYELLVAGDIEFAGPSIVKIGDYSLKTTAWQCDVKLNPETTYYWKVRAVNSDTYSAWSAVSAFTTAASPAPVPATPPQETQVSTGPTFESDGPEPTTRPLVSPMKSPASPEPPLPGPPAPAESPPGLLQPDAAPGWVLYLIAALMLVIFLLLIIMLVLVARPGRL